MNDNDPEARSVGDLMTREVVSVSPEDDVGRAHDLMRGRGFHAVPVVEDDAVVGILTTTDLLFDPDELSQVGAVMSGPPVFVHPTTAVADAASLMQERFIHHLVVVDEDRRELVGIVSSWDLLADLAHTVRSLTAAGIARVPARAGDRLVAAGVTSGAERTGDVIEVLGDGGHPPWVIRWEGDAEITNLRVVPGDEVTLDGCER